MPQERQRVATAIAAYELRKDMVLVRGGEQHEEGTPWSAREPPQLSLAASTSTFPRLQAQMVRLGHT